MRRLLLIFIVLLSGCVVEEDPESSTEKSAELGIVKGWVVDDHNQKLAEAEIYLDGEFRMKTPENGMYSVVAVEPGEHYLEARHPNFATTTRQVTVIGGDRAPQPVIISMQPVNAT